jgi:uncharacterized membrane protein
MSVTQPPSDAPFGLQPNVAAGLAYLLGIIGGIIMLVGGGTNRFVKWAAAQSIVFWVVYFILMFVVIPALGIILHGFVAILGLILWILGIVVWLWTFITAFQGKEVKIPGIAGITESIFKSMLG